MKLNACEFQFASILVEVGPLVAQIVGSITLVLLIIIIARTSLFEDS